MIPKLKSLPYRHDNRGKEFDTHNSYTMRDSVPVSKRAALWRTKPAIIAMKNTRTSHDITP